MSVELPTENKPRFAGRCVASLMLGLWLGLILLASFPELHHALHKDSREGTHSCLVTHLGKSSLAAAPIEISAFVASDACLYLGWICESQALPEFDFRVSASRAPPFLSSSTTVAG